MLWPANDSCEDDGATLGVRNPEQAQRENPQVSNRSRPGYLKTSKHDADQGVLAFLSELAVRAGEPSLFHSVTGTMIGVLVKRSPVKQDSVYTTRITELLPSSAWLGRSFGDALLLRYRLRCVLVLYHWL